VDYRGKIDRVYSIPDTGTANPREHKQMDGRNRNNKSKEVIIRYDGPYITPSEVDDDVLFKAEMSKIMTKKKYIPPTMTAYDREISKSIERLLLSLPNFMPGATSKNTKKYTTGMEHFCVYWRVKVKHGSSLQLNLLVRQSPLWRRKSTPWRSTGRKY